MNQSSVSLDDLDSAFRPTVDTFLAGCEAAGVPVRVIQTRRTRAEQEKNVAKGSSGTLNSRHLTGEAIDVCPEALLGEKNWAPASDLWWTIGQIGERLGMRWGGRWRKPHDCPHFERCRNGSEDARARKEQATGVQWPKVPPTHVQPVS
jgi:hypothetical protein